MVNRRNVLASVVIVGVALSFAAPWARAQADYPNRAIRMIVPVAAGGTADLCRASSARSSPSAGASRS